MSDVANFSFDELSKKDFGGSSNENLPKKYINEEVTRDLDFGVKESIYQVRLPYIENDEFTLFIAKFHLLLQDSTNIGIIVDPIYEEEKYAFFDEGKITEYILKHDSLYQTKTTKDDLIKDLTAYEPYGYMCGMAPVMNMGTQKDGLSFDDFKNIATFREWLRSYNPEIQTYGVDAIHHVYKKPNFLIGEEEKRIAEHDKTLTKHIAKRNSILYICEGCVIGIYRKVF